MSFEALRSQLAQSKSVEPMQITRGRNTQAMRMLVYGPAKVGKSTFAATFPNPLFVDLDHGTDDLDVARVNPSSYEELRDFLGRVPDGFDTLVIDTIDILERHIYAFVCLQNGWKNIESPGYGKGQIAALTVWDELINNETGLLSKLRKRGIQIVLLAQTMPKEHTNPSGSNYTMHDFTINQKSARLIMQWTDVIGFLDREYMVSKEDKITTSGKRVLRLNADGVFCGVRGTLNVPNFIEPSFDAINKLRNPSAKAPAPVAQESLYEECVKLLTEIHDEGGKIAGMVEAAKNEKSKLARYLVRIKEIKEKQNADV